MLHVRASSSRITTLSSTLFFLTLAFALSATKFSIPAQLGEKERTGGEPCYQHEPTALAPKSFAAAMHIRPSPQPRS